MWVNHVKLALRFVTFFLTLFDSGAICDLKTINVGQSHKIESDNVIGGQFI